MEKGLKGEMTLDGDNSVTLCTRSIQGLLTVCGAAWYGSTAAAAALVLVAVVGRRGSIESSAKLKLALQLSAGK